MPVQGCQRGPGNCQEQERRGRRERRKTWEGKDESIEQKERKRS